MKRGRSAHASELRVDVPSRYRERRLNAAAISRSEMTTMELTMRSKLSRRVILQGLGATVALPWLESARLLAADAPSDNAPPKRFAFLFFGDGIHPPQWW